MSGDAHTGSHRPLQTTPRARISRWTRSSLEATPSRSSACAVSRAGRSWCVSIIHWLSARSADRWPRPWEPGLLDQRGRLLHV